MKIILIIIMILSLILIYLFVGAGPGETIGSQGIWSFCRPGLTAVGGHTGGYQGNCDNLPSPTGLNRCTNCGNNICDTQNGENHCNCSVDCR